jgi:outer membrane receptor protein involved in Fe transport
MKYVFPFIQVRFCAVGLMLILLILAPAALQAHREFAPGYGESDPWTPPESEDDKQSGTSENEPKSDPPKDKAEPYNQADLVTLDEVTVSDERPLTASSDQTVRNADFMRFPRRSASDLLRFVPGLHITQHTGGAKAHQIFLRGFDAEHGQDIAAFIDGIPVNQPSHVHGQGYLDLHFMIPETIQKIWVMKGPYDSRYGAFATAGVIDFIPYRSRQFSGSMSLGVGSDYAAEGLAQLSKPWLGMLTYAAAQADYTDGFTDPGTASAGRGFLMHSIALPHGLNLRVMYIGYAARSEASDVLPLTLIEKGRVARYGSIDPTNRVDADHHLLALTLDGETFDSRYRVQVYYGYTHTDIFSNYTFYFYHPEKGDQAQQVDERHTLGAQGYFRFYNTAGEIRFQTEFGLQLRSDIVDQSQRNSEHRVPFNTINHYEFTETGIGLYADERITPLRWLRLIAGCRLDQTILGGAGTQDTLRFDIATNKSALDDDAPLDFTHWSWALSPKLSAIFSPHPQVDLFINFGRTFSALQARRQANEPDSSLPAVTGAELGLVSTFLNKALHLSASGWWAEKESDSVFDSEAGASVEQGRSRRLGADLEIRIQPSDWLTLATDVFYVWARFVDEDRPIPNMASWHMVNVLAVEKNGFSATLRGRFLGPRTHDLGLHSAAYYVVDAQLGYTYKHIGVSLSVENLLNSEWNDSVYAYPSRPIPEGPVYDGLHVTPGAPTTARLRLTVDF